MAHGVKAARSESAGLGLEAVRHFKIESCGEKNRSTIKASLGCLADRPNEACEFAGHRHGSDLFRLALVH